MPVFPPARQDAMLAWFAAAPAQALRQAEHHFLHQQLHAFPAQPWLWIAPARTWLPEPHPAGRGMALYRAEGNGRGWQGMVRCHLPLPLPSQAVNAIVLQHVTLAELDALVAECARIIQPGGRVWLSVFNRKSLYRRHWQRNWERLPSLAQSRASLQREGLYVRATHYCGPLWGQSKTQQLAWLGRLRAVCVMEAEKRSSAPIGPERLSVSFIRQRPSFIAI